MNKKVLYIVIAALFVLLAFASNTVEVNNPLGQASPGLAAQLASTTEFTLTSAAIVITATSTNCSARIITTGTDSGIGFTFDSPLGIANFGHWQAASTTQVYDGGLWGCGTIRARSAESAASITISNVQ